MIQLVCNRPLTVLLVFTVFMLTLGGCQRDPQDFTGPAAKLVEGQGPLPYVEKYAEMVAARRGEPMNLSLMESVYTEHLAAYVADADQRYGTHLATTAAAALGAGIHGERSAENAQIAEKSVQRAFIISFQESLKALTKDVADDEAYKRLLLSSQVIRSVAQRRGEWLKKGPEYAVALDDLLAQLFDQVNRRSQKTAIATIAQVDELTTKVLVLSVLYELDGLIKIRGADDTKAGEKRVEALIYYDSVRAAHHSRNAKGAGTVSGILAKALYDMEADLAGSILLTDFRSELSGVEPDLRKLF